MAYWEEQFWQSPIESGSSRRDRKSGTYYSYVPDTLADSPLLLTPSVDRLVAKAERAARSINDSRDLAGIARFLLRSEAIASSRIEGVTPSASQVVLAELEAGADEGLLGTSEQAQLVARNMTIVRSARTELADTDVIRSEHLEALQSALLENDPDLSGCRRKQNWIGGSSYHPIDADFIPPSPERVPAFIDDLVAYMNGAAHSPIVQAALVHAQLETIHPFADGNGRVGRALIHALLTRRGVTAHAVLPISQVLSTLSHEYVAALSAYRHDAPPGSDAFHAARTQWIEFFAGSVLTATEQAATIEMELMEVREEWNEAIERHRAATGKKRALRSDSITQLILDDLPSTPILTTSSAIRIHGGTRTAAHNALGDLVEAGILRIRRARGKYLYSAPAVLELIDLSVRRPASTRFDTRVSPPTGPAPARPARARSS